MTNWNELFLCIWNDLREPVFYLPQGILTACLCLLATDLFCIVLGRSIKKTHERWPLWFVCICYGYILLNMVFFSREPGSRTGVDLQFLGTWGNTAEAQGYVIENILLFMPFGFLSPLCLRHFKRGKLCILAGCLCSVGIELVQFLTQTGYCQLDDVIMNTLGTALGFGIYLCFARLKKAS